MQTTCIIASQISLLVAVKLMCPVLAAGYVALLIYNFPVISEERNRGQAHTEKEKEVTVN